MSNYVNNNGVLIPFGSYSIKVGNRGHLYGDGLFESIRVLNGRPINLNNHYKRLMEGMKALKMLPPNNFTLDFLQNEIQDLIDQNDIQQGGKVRISVDRKAGGAFLPITSDVEYFIEAYGLPNNRFMLNEEGWKIDQYEDIKKRIDFLSPFKTKNCLIYIMAKMIAKERGLDELLIQNDKMGIIEGASSNLFVVSNGVLYTPGLELGCLGGTMRMQIINIAIENNIKVYECNISPQNLLVADEVFLTNAVQGIIWVGSYRTKEYSNELAHELTELINIKWKAK